MDDQERAFLRARLNEDEARAREIMQQLDEGYYDDLEGLVRRVSDQERDLREVGVWRRILLEYAIPPGTDAVYGGTEREKGFRLALSFALKAKMATYSGHPDYPADRQPEATQHPGG